MSTIQSHIGQPSHRKLPLVKAKNAIAGDDEPYYIYKREKFLQMLLELPLKGKSVLEIGPGPGGNLLAIQERKPSRLVGCDISQEMIEIAQSRVDPSTELFKTNGTTLPFQNQEFDIVFSATVFTTQFR